MLYLQAATKAYDIAMTWVHKTIGHDHRAEAIVAAILLDASLVIPLLLIAASAPELLAEATGHTIATTDPIAHAATCAAKLLALDLVAHVAAKALQGD